MGIERTRGNTNRFFKFLGKPTRSSEIAANNLGKLLDRAPIANASTLRQPELDIFDAYYESRQYDHLVPWATPQDADAPYVPIRNRNPLLKFNFARILSDRLVSKIMGAQTKPKFTVETDPLTDEYLRVIQRNALFGARLIEPLRRMFVAGSVFVRFFIEAGTIKMEHYLSKYCFPTFDAAGELETIEVRFVFRDTNDRDEEGNPKKKWFRLILTQFLDRKYAPVEFKEDEKFEDIKWTIENEVEHNLGFVQGEWFRTFEVQNKVDGIPLIMDVLGFIDELNYNLSQSSQVLQYNQDPQLVINGLDEEELDQLIKSSLKAWNLGREGKASYLETTLESVERASEFRDKITVKMTDIARIILMDPEKVVAHAQSARALEVLHGPMLDLINEMRPFIEASLIKLLTKIAVTNLVVGKRGEIQPVSVPRGFVPQNLMGLTAQWPPVFAMTMDDLQKKVGVAVQASNNRLISKETGMGWIAKDFGVEDLEEEKRKIEEDMKAEAALSPFGAF